VVTAVPLGGSARISDIWNVPAAWPMSTRPASSTSPPAEVTSSACRAAARAELRMCCTPISRYDVMDVSSQAVNRVIRSSAMTMPTIAPANIVSKPARRSRLSTLALPSSAGSCCDGANYHHE
jgi:hypothetical protein